MKRGKGENKRKIAKLLKYTLKKKTIKVWKENNVKKRKRDQQPRNLGRTHSHYFRFEN